MSVKSFPVPVYSGRVVICTTRPAYLKVRKDLKDPDNERGLKESHGLHIRILDEKRNESVYVVGWFDKRLGTLVHELAHMTFEVLTYSGVPISKRNDEAFAYLLDALFTAAVGKTARSRRR